MMIKFKKGIFPHILIIGTVDNKIKNVCYRIISVRTSYIRTLDSKLFNKVLFRHIKHI